jgi:hypothetical protein
LRDDRWDDVFGTAGSDQQRTTDRRKIFAEIAQRPVEERDSWSPGGGE